MRESKKSKNNTLVLQARASPVQGADFGLRRHAEKLCSVFIFSSVLCSKHS
jgi:hypothetical protein